MPVRVSDHGDAYLLVSFDLTLDDERRYLTVRKSTLGLYLLTDRREPLFRYEFDRDKSQVTQAHLHVHGQSHALGRLYGLAGKGATAELHRLHLPVGGKRFRPSLEDVLECLFVERLLQPLSGWREAVDEHRARYHRIQLRAAIRRHPEIAFEALRDFGLLG